MPEFANFTNRIKKVLLQTFYLPLSKKSSVFSKSKPTLSKILSFLSRGEKLNKPLHKIHRSLKIYFYNIIVKPILYRKEKEQNVQLYNIRYIRGEIYQTNVIANKQQSEEEVYQIAQEQVVKQWAN